MFSVGSLLRTHKGNPDGISIHFDGCSRISVGRKVVINGAVHGYFTKARKVPKEIRNCGVKSWGVEDDISIICDISPKASKKLSVANLCGTCVNKDIFVSVNGEKKKHIYSVHPAKETKAVRCWWIDADRVLHIHTWPWNAK